MPWTMNGPPSVAKNWKASERAKCVSAANAVLRDGDWENASDEERGKLEAQAIQACIRNAGKSEKYAKMLERLEKFGGPGSGYHGHAGRPGQVGGSSSGGGSGGGGKGGDFNVGDSCYDATDKGKKIPVGTIVETVKSNVRFTVSRSNGYVLSGFRYGEGVDLRQEDAKIVGFDPAHSFQPSLLSEEFGGPGSGHHGHAGRPGQVGGSSSGGVSSSQGIAPAPGDATNEDSRAKQVLNTGLPNMLDDEDQAYNLDRWMGVSDEDRGKIKDEIVQYVADNTDMTYDEANAFVGQWAHSSNDTDMRSLAIQKDAADEFGVELSEFQKERLTRIDEMRSEPHWKHEGGTIELTKENYPHLYPLFDSDKQRQALRAMYDHTQSMLRDAGYKTGDMVRLFRGVGTLGRSDANVWRVGDRLTVTGSALESWSVGHIIAHDFAQMAASTGGSRLGHVFAVDMPVERVFCTSRTGFGCLAEGEFIVFGGVDDVTITYRR